jgi:hypothetical protein
MAVALSMKNTCLRLSDCSYYMTGKAMLQDDVALISRRRDKHQQLGYTTFS